MILLVTYDLHGRRDYKPVVDVLETASSYVHPLGSVWILDTSKDCAQWRDALKEAGDADDEFYVVELKKHWAATGTFDASARRWLKDANRSWR